MFPWSARQEVRAVRGVDISIEEAESVVGGGSTPGQKIAGPILCVNSSLHTPNQIEEGLRLHRPPIMVRIEKDRLLIDLRTVLEGEEEEIVAALEKVGAGIGRR